MCSRSARFARATSFTGIANRINLPELLLPKLMSGPAKFNRILFEPYTEMQVAAILESRVDAGVALASRRSLSTTSAASLLDAPAATKRQLFHPLAIKLIARKVSQKSAGDARKALELASATVSTLHKIACLQQISADSPFTTAYFLCCGLQRLLSAIMTAA